MYQSQYVKRINVMAQASYHRLGFNRPGCRPALADCPNITVLRKNWDWLQEQLQEETDMGIKEVLAKELLRVERAIKLRSHILP